MRRVTRGLLVLTSLAVTATACSDGGETAVPATTSTSTTAASSTTAPTTTSAPTTSTTESTTTTNDEAAALEAELVAVIEGANSIFLLDPIDPESPIIEEYYSMSLGEDVRSNLEARLEAGESYFGSIELETIYSADLSGTGAIVAACALDGVGVAGSDGAVAIAAATQPNLVNYELVLENDAWRLDVVRLPGAEREPCV